MSFEDNDDYMTFDKIDHDYNYIIVGAGITGITLANKLAEHGKVLLIEKEDHVGGLCYDCRDENGILIHPYSPHIFHTNNEKVFKYLSRFTYWNSYVHKVVRLIDDKNVPIPFNLISLEKCLENKADDITSNILKEFDVNDKLTLSDLENSNIEEIREFGKYLYNKILEPYYSKIYGKYTREVLELSNKCVFSVSYDCRYFPDIHQAIPTDGYSKMFEKMLDNENIKVILNCDYRDIMTFKENEVYLNNGMIFSGKIFFTARIDRLNTSDDNILLHYTTMHHINEKIDHVKFQETPVTEQPDEYHLTRTIEYKYLTNQQIPYTTIQFEFPGGIDEGFPDFTPYYPVRTQQNIDTYDMIVKNTLKYNNVYFMGRLGWFEDVSIAEAVERTLNLLEKEFKIE